MSIPAIFVRQNPPYHHPVFVTHYARERLELADATFYFVTEGVDAALSQARRAAGAKDVALAGGSVILYTDCAWRGLSPPPR